MKQDITQKGGEDCEPPIYTGNDEFDKKKKEEHDACNKRNDAEIQNRNADRYLEQQQYRENRKKERKAQAEAERARKAQEEAERDRKQKEADKAAQKKRDEQEAAEARRKEEKAAANAKKYKENEISYSTGIFSSPIKYKSKVGTEFEFYINKNGDKFVGISGQQKYLWDPKKGSLHQIDVNNNISPAQSASAYILTENEFQPIKTKALAKLESKGFSFSFFGNKEKQEEEEKQQMSPPIVYVGGKRKTKKSKKSTKKSKKSTKKTRKSRK